MRPVLKGVYRMESLYDGTIDLLAVARANYALDVQAENERRWQVWQERNH